MSSPIRRPPPKAPSLKSASVESQWPSPVRTLDLHVAMNDIRAKTVRDPGWDKLNSSGPKKNYSSLNCFVGLRIDPILSKQFKRDWCQAGWVSTFCFFMFQFFLITAMVFPPIIMVRLERNFLKKHPKFGAPIQVMQLWNIVETITWQILFCHSKVTQWEPRIRSACFHLNCQETWFQVEWESNLLLVKINKGSEENQLFAYAGYGESVGLMSNDSNLPEMCHGSVP